MHEQCEGCGAPLKSVLLCEYCKRPNRSYREPQSVGNVNGMYAQMQAQNSQYGYGSLMYCQQGQGAALQQQVSMYSALAGAAIGAMLGN